MNETLSSTFGLSRAIFQGQAAPGKTKMEIKAQQKLTIVGPVFFLRRSLKEARKCTAGFQSTAFMCVPRDKLHKGRESWKWEEPGGGWRRLSRDYGSIWKDEWMKKTLGLRWYEKNKEEKARMSKPRRVQAKKEKWVWHLAPWRADTKEEGWQGRMTWWGTWRSGKGIPSYRADS